MATTTINWNLSGQTYVHAQLGDDFNGTGTKDRPFQTLYRGARKGGTIIAMGLFSELVPSVNDSIAIYADSFGAAIFDGGRTTGLGGAVHNHANTVGDDTTGFHIYYKYIYNFIYLRSRVPVGSVGVGYNLSSRSNGFVGGGSLLVDSFNTCSVMNGHNCAFIYPKCNNNANSNDFSISAWNASYSYETRQTAVGVKFGLRRCTSTKLYCTFDECTIPLIYNNTNKTTFNHCVFRNCRFVIPASLAVDKVEHVITSNMVARATEEGGSSHANYLAAWAEQYAVTNYTKQAFTTIKCLYDEDPLFNNLNIVWRDATTGEVVSKADSENAYADPELCTLDISIDANSPAVEVLSAYGADWRGAPSVDYKMGPAEDLLVNELASGDIALSGNLTFEEDAQTGKKYITWAKPFNDPTIVDAFKGGSIITRPRMIPSALLFKYPKIAGSWASAFLGEGGRGETLLGRNFTLSEDSVQFEGEEAQSIPSGYLWLKDNPDSWEIVAGRHYILKSGSVGLYNSANMTYIEFTEGAIICTEGGDTKFLKVLYDGALHDKHTAELQEVLPNAGATTYDYRNRLEIRIFNKKEDANRYQSPELAEKNWIPINVITDTLTGIHYYDLPQNDIIFDENKGFLINQNPYANETATTLAVSSQHTSERYDSYMGDDVASKAAGVYTKTTTQKRARFAFSPLNGTNVYVQLRFKIIPFTWPTE